ncbi:hypothetical protein BDP55DRAFT_701353 [Colletotrichum godetiae]|uniref:PRISE-like Rossmann-fold domain-containing protein n=1 Tax=Colletotrichum godetiae TaxID=1209918 RepID=A0AAJ0F234_9PEZI|nr:uncharacterized protein BDP55DRAFT_701353 [Colletotrichum godetiae]KAK1690118.1 hypothetical protein BDP55DRAFT_701353 [Colletotrichum godetiae]
MAHALILGASGISGWSLLNQARTYPTPTTFARITGTTNRALTLEEARLPADDPRLAIVSGIDFTRGVDDVAAAMREKIPDVETVSHVFYTATANTEFLSVAIQAIEKVSPRLAFVVLQTGGRGYGLMCPDTVRVLRTPLREDAPRIPRPWADEVFYYAQHDLLQELSRGKGRTFSEIRPDGIVGFAPTANAMNMARGVGIYLSVWRYVFGTGAAGGVGRRVEVPFPGSLRGYRATHTDTFQDVLSKMEIFAAVVNPEECGGGKAFNVADGEAVSSWSGVWPRLCAHFGLVGVAPSSPPPPPSGADTNNETDADADTGTGTASGSTNPPSMKAFIAKHDDAWVALAREHELDEGAAREYNWDFLHLMLVQCDFDREYDLTRAREVGFEEEIDTVEGYFTAWERMRDAKQLPSF